MFELIVWTVLLALVFAVFILCLQIVCKTFLCCLYCFLLLIRWIFPATAQFLRPLFIGILVCLNN